MKNVQSNAGVLGHHLDTDQIISAEMMKYDPSTEEGRVTLGQRCFCGLAPDVQSPMDPKTKASRYRVLLAGDNFGCGSSREHAPVALAMAGIQVVMARSFARIFYRNCISSGELLPVIVPELNVDELTNGVLVKFDAQEQQVSIAGKTYDTEPLGELAEIVEAGGLFGYARQQGRL